MAFARGVFYSSAAPHLAPKGRHHLRFDPVNDVVVADLSFNELNSIPARF
jgi:hypothetical protein